MINILKKIIKLPFTMLYIFVFFATIIVIVDKTAGWKKELISLRNASVSVGTTIGTFVLEKGTPVVEKIAKNLEESRKHHFLLRPFVWVFKTTKGFFTVLIFGILVPMMLIYMFFKAGENYFKKQVQDMKNNFLNATASRINLPNTAPNNTNYEDINSI